MTRRIDIETLVRIFEERINELDKNPPQAVPQSVIFNMLRESIDNQIAIYFKIRVNKEIDELIKKELKKVKSTFIKKTLSSIIKSEDFRLEVEDNIKRSIIAGIRNIGQ